jgi:hypothetical protein
MNSTKSQVLLWASCMLLAGLPATRAHAVACVSDGGRAAATKWFEQYDLAWEHRDVTAASALFSENAVYREDPFESPMRGERAIRDYWNGVAREQRNVRVSYEILSVCGNVSIVHWRARFMRVPSKQRVRLDGIAEITLDTHGKCVLFREWWDRDQK